MRKAGDEPEAEGNQNQARLIRPKSRYDNEFKLLAVRRVESGLSVAAAARTLGIAEQTLWNWVKAKREGRLYGTDSMSVNAEQIEVGHLRAKLVREQIKYEILMKGHRVLCETISSKYAFIQDNSRTWPVSLMCEVLGVRPRGYRRHINRQAGSCARTRLGGGTLSTQTKAILNESKGSYRWFRGWAESLTRGLRWLRSRRAR